MASGGLSQIHLHIAAQYLNYNRVVGLHKIYIIGTTYNR